MFQEFRSDGFALLDAFLDPGQLDVCRQLVESRRAQPPMPGCVRPNNTLLPLSWNDGIVDLCLSVERRTQAIASTIAATDLRWISGYISTKEPSSPPLWWHQDWWCWDHPASFLPTPPQVAVLCYLVDTERSNGALRLLPGSHIKSADVHALLPEAHGRSAGELQPDHPAMADLPGQLTPCLKAGDAVVMDYRLLHGTHANCSDSRRDCILLSFCPHWKALPVELRSHLIQHPAQPAASDLPAVPETMKGLLPEFLGARESLPLNRNAPATF